MKTVRQQLRADGFSPNFGEQAAANRVTNAETGEDWSAFVTTCEPTDDSSGVDDSGAVLYARKKDGEIYVRSIAKAATDLVTVNDCTCDADDYGAADDVNHAEYRIPVDGGSE